MRWSVIRPRFSPRICLSSRIRGEITTKVVTKPTQISNQSLNTSFKNLRILAQTCKPPLFLAMVAGLGLHIGFWSHCNQQIYRSTWNYNLFHYSKEYYQLNIAGLYPSNITSALTQRAGEVIWLDAMSSLQDGLVWGKQNLAGTSPIRWSNILRHYQ